MKKFGFVMATAVALGLLSVSLTHTPVQAKTLWEGFFEDVRKIWAPPAATTKAAPAKKAAAKKAPAKKAPAKPAAATPAKPAAKK